MAPGSAVSPDNRYFFKGIRDLLPMVPGTLPFGLIVGASGNSLGFSPDMTLGMTLLFYAGSAQLAACQLIQEQALPAVIVFTALMMNIRFLVYSAAFAPLLHPLKARHRWPLAYLLSDQAYGLCASRFPPQDKGRQKLYYFSGAALAVWVNWIAAVGLGLLVGERIPAEWSLEFAIPLTFLAMLAPLVRDRASLVTVMVAALLATGLSRLPFNLGFIVAIGGGIATGLLSTMFITGAQQKTRE